MNRWGCRQLAAARCRHRSPTEAGIVRTRNVADVATPTRGSVTNGGRDLARTAFFHAGRCLKHRLNFCGGDLPKDSRQAADRWHERNMRRENSHRSATNLYPLTIVAAAIGDNLNIRVRAASNHKSACARVLRIAATR